MHVCVHTSIEPLSTNCPSHIALLSCSKVLSVYEFALYLYLAHIYITDNWFDPPSDITAIPQSYTVHCVIIGEELERVHYYYNDTPESELSSTYCLSQAGYNCSLANNNTVTSDMTPDNVVDKTVTFTWEAKEISSGAFRQSSNHGDHQIRCHLKENSIERESIIWVKGTYNNKY